jgi:hypothetical protein
MDIHVNSTPNHLKVTDTMLDDFIDDPAMGAYVLLGEKLDAFQSARLKYSVWVPRVMDSSGVSSAKTRNMFIKGVLRCMLIGNHHTLVAYPKFDSGKQIYWPLFNEIAAKSAIFRANSGAQRIIGIDGTEEEWAKAQKKEASALMFHFKNGSKITLPAIGFIQNARMMAGFRCNDLDVDEHTKSEAAGSSGIDEQLITRATRDCFNKNHPFWKNHQFFCATAEDVMHPSFDRYKTFLDEVNRGNPDYAVLRYDYHDYSDLPYQEEEFSA